MLIQFNEFIPTLTIDIAAALIVVVVLIGVVYKFRRWIRVLPSSFFQVARTHLGIKKLVILLFSELGNRVILERDVINDSRLRKITHIVVFWGFIGLAFATVWDDVFFHQGTLPPPFSLANPGNIVGNIGGVLLLCGMTIMIVRYAIAQKFKKSAKGDLTFLFLLYFATISGFASELARYLPSWIADPNFVIHLAFVSALLITAPFTHFFHSLLTPVLRYFGRVQQTLAEKGIVKYPYPKKMTMADLAVDI
ncbi:MAG: hypothetical protein JRN20_21205, partial [Nitrososphaerota archaeon]|nr:hypothetical protein [Nitrososphaerota archaeon]